VAMVCFVPLAPVALYGGMGVGHVSFDSGFGREPAVFLGLVVAVGALVALVALRNTVFGRPFRGLLLCCVALFGLGMVLGAVIAKEPYPIPPLPG
jgi:hypothetical protein